MLDSDRIDLDSIATALEDHSGLGHWIFDPEFGAAVPADVGTDETPKSAIVIEPLPSSVGYGDLEEFVGHVSDAHARDVLSRAIAGRGAFRRFKDALTEFPDLRASWFAFHDARMRRRAVEWLRDARLIDDATAGRLADDHPDPPVPATGDERIARVVAADLKQLFGERLRDVLFFGSRARGQSQPDSDLDILVVLDHIANRYEELTAMSDILWNRTMEFDVLISVVPVSEADVRDPRKGFITNALSEGRNVA